MRRLILIFLITFISCKDFSILEKDQENIFFFKNERTTEKEFSGQLSVATFNIKFGYCQTCDPFSGEIGGDYKQLDRIIDLINSLDLDIVSLQEVGLDYDVTIVQNQIEYIAQKTNMNYAFGMAREIQNNILLNGYWGNAILSKYKILNVENPAVRFIDYYNQNRCLKTTINLDNSQEIVVLNTHFESGSTIDEKNIQINQIKNLVYQETKPYIFTGDLNIPYIGGIDYMSKLNQKFNNSLDKISQIERENIFNSGTFINGSVLDYIFTDKTNFSIHSAKLAPSETWDISDHYLYLVNMTIL